MTNEPKITRGTFPCLASEGEDKQLYEEVTFTKRQIEAIKAFFEERCCDRDVFLSDHKILNLIDWLNDRLTFKGNRNNMPSTNCDCRCHLDRSCRDCECGIHEPKYPMNYSTNGIITSDHRSWFDDPKFWREEKTNGEVDIPYPDYHAMLEEQDRRTIRRVWEEMREIKKVLKNTEFRSSTMSSGKCEHSQQLTAAYKNGLEDLEDEIGTKLAALDKEKGV